MSTVKLPIEQIHLDARFQARSRVELDAVDDYAEAYRAGADMPPADVFEVSGAHFVVDGFHRVPAALAAGLDFLRVRVVGSGSIDEAIWYATGVNQAHGVRRSPEDKRRAVRMALDCHGGAQSDRAVAEHCGVSNHLVARVRRAQVGHLPPDEAPPKRTGRDGKQYPAPVAPPPVDVEPLPFEQEYVPPAAPVSMPKTGATLRGAAGTLRLARLEAVAVLREAGCVVEAQRVTDLVKQAEAVCLAGVPYECGRCEGSGCDACAGRGWLTGLAGS